jgi:hypothetical protein
MDIGYVDGISSMVDFSIVFNTGHITEAEYFSLCISLNLHYTKTGSMKYILYLTAAFGIL